ncbi:class I SAM-dependent methyltransferase [Marinobacter sp. HL-58]|uniref:class I SAM-dependent methyltransferase n=1 Tax=Marinobacter sp. HL-58 TaxID=1479237 RepID=UPI0004890B32|nr:class I SAM-dependent methyltransferase [Marinobacter sp. HL-58]KPP99346.1 MAG: 16S RNA G1207 methylase RsmC [Marinobacter sp. HL-58]
MWDERFAQDDYVYGEEPNKFLVEQLCSQELSDLSGAVLCLAEGEGRNAVYMASHNHDVTCVDLSSVGLEKAKKLALKNQVNLTTIQADLATYEPLPSAYDAVVMIFAHTPSAVRERVLKNARLALKPGGYLILEGYTVDQIGRGTGGPGDPDMMFYREEVETVFARDHILVCEEKVRDIQEGSLHTGPGAVLQCVVRKGEFDGSIRR